jgi:hypothetical protein
MFVTADSRHLRVGLAADFFNGIGIHL